MMTGRRQPIRSPDNTGKTGYESELWAMADVLLGGMGTAEYKYIVLGL